MKIVLSLTLLFFTTLFSLEHSYIHPFQDKNPIKNNEIKIIFTPSIKNDFLTPQQKAFIQNNPVIKVGGEMDWPPYDFVKNGNYQGIAKDYLNLISKKTGLIFDIKTGFTWPELLNMTKNKKLDMLPIITQLKEREEYLLFTQPYIKVRQYAFVLESNENINHIEDLNEKTVAIPKGYASIAILKKSFPKINILETNNVLDSIDKLITKKADAIIENNALVSFLIKENNIGGIKPVFNVNLISDYLNMATRKDAPILKEILEKTLESITHEEKIKIANKWIAFNEKEKFIQLTQKEKQFILNHPVIKVTNNQDWEPYDFYHNKQAQGYLVDYLKLIGTKTGLQFKFITKPWHELQEGLKAKTIDMSLALSKNRDREKYLLFTPSYFSQNRSIITQRNRTDIRTLNDLNKKIVALGKGWGFTKAIKKHYPKIIVKEYDSSVNMLEAVAYGEADATIDDFTIANYFMTKHRLHNLKVSGKAIIKGYENELFMGIRNDWPLLLTIINKAMENITTQELQQLNKKWDKQQTTIKTILTKKEELYLANKIFKLTATSQWAPFSFKHEETNEIQGISIDFWKLLAKKANIAYEFNFQDSFADVLDSIKNKQADIIFATGETKERKNYANFTQTYQNFPIAIATNKNQNFIPDINSLKGKKIAVGKNYTAHKILEKNHPELTFVLTKNTSQALELLASGKVDAVIDIVPTLIHYINNKGYTNLKISGHTGYTMDIKFMVRNDYVELIPILNKLISTITKKEKQAIYDKWFSVKYEQGFDYTLLWQVILGFTIIVAFIIYKNRQLITYQRIIQAKNETLEKQKSELENSYALINKTQKELENSLQNFTTLVDSTLEAIVIIADNKILYVNDEAVKLFQESSKEYLNNKDILSLFSTHSQQELLKIMETNSTESYELVAQKSNQDNFPVLIQTKAINFKNQEAKIISIVDLTDLKDKDKVIQEQSKMASMGEMIGNIAHQWRQPLSIISTSASGLHMSKEFNTLDDKTFDDAIKNILNNTVFLSQTIDDFKNFILQNKELVHFDLEHLIKKTLVLIEASLKGNHIEVLTEVDKEVSLFNYENELNQVLINIINNAKDALKENNADNERYIFIKAYKDNENAIIKVRDNGAGIQDEIIHQIFEPYFTTKHQAQGTGLGLYMTHKLIVESLGGTISAENISFIFKDKNYKGAEICITIPLFKRSLKTQQENIIQ